MSRQPFKLVWRQTAFLACLVLGACTHTVLRPIPCHLPADLGIPASAPQELPQRAVTLDEAVRLWFTDRAEFQKLVARQHDTVTFVEKNCQ